MTFAFEATPENNVVIRVIGVGGGGGNAVNRMVTTGVRGIDFVAINTDKQALNYSAATMKLQIGQKITGGLGCGSNPGVGSEAAQENEDEIRQMLQGANMVFITAGMGGGTGTGGAPVVARIAKEMGILTVGVVTRPFNFEGKKRIEQANAGIAALREQVDALVVIPNERLKLVSEQKITFQNAFEVADSVLHQAVQSISELMTVPGLINLDFNDVATIMRGAGYAHMGVGRASGKEKAVEAAKMAIASPLLETSINGARGVLLLLFQFEVLREAGSRTTSSLGQTLSVVGGLVIGQSAVEAKMVAAPTLIVVAFSGITGLIAPKLKSAVFLSRLLLILLANFYGIYGYFIGVVVLLAWLARLRSFGVPMLSGLPLNRKGSGEDSYIRPPFTAMKKFGRFLAGYGRHL